MLIIGLGNPGEKFKSTRHNAGFMFLDYLKNELCPDEKWKKDCDSIVCVAAPSGPILSTFSNTPGVWILAKPQTFMNTSGEAVVKLLKKYQSVILGSEATPESTPESLLTSDSGLPPMGVARMTNFVVAHDDLDLPLGEFRIQKGRGAAGHHGVESLIEKLGTKDFWRVRIGINSESRKVVNSDPDFVLKNFTRDEKVILQGVFKSVSSKTTPPGYRTVPGTPPQEGN